MFSGIIAAVGRITELAPRNDGTPTVRLRVDAGKLGLEDVALGDSIACSGVCLTVVDVQGNAFFVDASPETLSCTIGLDAPGPVNLEKALRLADRLGGHLVSGHVDGQALIIGVVQDGESRRFVFEAPAHLARFIAIKGSVALDGTSLTVNEVAANQFGVNLIPHTLTATTWGRKKPGDTVNLEADTFARYVARLMEFKS